MKFTTTGIKIMFAGIRNCLLICALTLSALSASSAQSSDARARIREATSGFKDITLTCKVLYANHNELKKIGKDFPKSYEFKSTTVWYKAPDKMKVEGKLGMVNVSITMTDRLKFISIPSLRYSKKEDIRDDPHKRQTDLDIGIVTESLWEDYTVTAVSTERGSDGSVYKITFVRDNAKSKKHIAWVEVDSFRLLKVEKYDNDGSMKSRFIYSNHAKVGGVWVPRKIDVHSPTGKLAATTAYEGIKVNSGLDDSIFKF